MGAIWVIVSHFLVVFLYRLNILQSCQLLAFLVNRLWVQTMSVRSNTPHKQTTSPATVGSTLGSKPISHQPMRWKTLVRHTCFWKNSRLCLPDRNCIELDRVRSMLSKTVSSLDWVKSTFLTDSSHVFPSPQALRVSKNVITVLLPVRITT